MWNEEVKIETGLTIKGEIYYSLIIERELKNISVISLISIVDAFDKLKKELKKVIFKEQIMEKIQVALSKGESITELKQQLIECLEAEKSDALKWARHNNMSRYNEILRQINTIKNGGIEMFNYTYTEKDYDKLVAKDKLKEEGYLDFENDKLIKVED